MEFLIIVLLLALLFEPVRQVIGFAFSLSVIAFVVVALMAYGVIPN